MKISRAGWALAAMAMAFVAAPSSARSQAMAKTVTCKDGTSSKAGRGACSKHGGMADAAAATAATPEKMAPAATKAMDAKMVSCKDGTMSKAGRGACSGHGGVGDGMMPNAAAQTKMATPAKGMSEAKSAEKPAAMAAPGGGAGQVWVNTKSGVFHRQGDEWYGKTKAGKYMTEAEALKAGYRAEKGNMGKKP